MDRKVYDKLNSYWYMIVIWIGSFFWFDYFFEKVIYLGEYELNKWCFMNLRENKEDIQMDEQGRGNGLGYSREVFLKYIVQEF